MNNLDITPELALAAARVLRDYCKSFGPNYSQCRGCVFDKECAEMFHREPIGWKLPERRKDE